MVTHTCTHALLVLLAFTATNHTGYCIESSPRLGAAQLSDIATSISVNISVPAVSFVADCALLFTPETSAQLGRNAICSVDSNTGGMELRIPLRVCCVMGHSKPPPGTANLFQSAANIYQTAEILQ